MFTDYQGVSRSMMLAWNGQIWTVFSQRYALTNIVSYEQNSCITAYGTDGSVVVQLHTQPDPALEKVIATKSFIGKSLLAIKNWKRAFVHMRDLAGQPEGSFLTGELTTYGGGIPNGSEQVSFECQPNVDDMRPYPTTGQGMFASLDLRGNSPDYVLLRILLSFEDRTLFGA